MGNKVRAITQLLLPTKTQNQRITIDYTTKIELFLRRNILTFMKNIKNTVSYPQFATFMKNIKNRAVVIPFTC